MEKISVVICTHSPNLKYLNQVLSSLQHQTLSYDEWELIIIDNNSSIAVKSLVDISWHPNSKLVKEGKPGLIHARIRGTKEADFPILVSVDDDTPLDINYLTHVQRIYFENPHLGVIGGKTIPVFDVPPPDWLNEFFTCLAIRDLGNDVIIQKLDKAAGLKEYPSASPLLIAPRKACMEAYIDYFNDNSASQLLGRKGESLASGEDNDINLYIFKQGYSVGYFPELKFFHLIPERRLSVNYLATLHYNMNRSWIQVLSMHNICSWKAIPRWTLPLRKIKSWFKNKAWRGSQYYIRWKGNCGLFEGLTEIS